MTKIIKRKIKKSFPGLLIVILLSSTVSGLFFSLDFGVKISFENRKVDIDFNLPIAEAQDDTATTSVTVKNAPPEFTTQTAESPSSTSTSPINVGDEISFQATASDDEGNQYYLIVCSSVGATAGAGGAAPSCTGTEFCVSDATNADSQASCDYAVVDPGAESDEWYSYVCDNHASEAECSDSYSQGIAPGAGDDSSPFYVNHAPSLTAVATSDDNKAPGADFQITASVTDTDVSGGADVLELFVCSTDSWATSTGCTANQICYATSTSADVTCTGSTTIPTVDQAYTYYAFVKDWHEMPATGNSQTSTYTITNVLPAVGGVDLNDGNDIILNLKGAIAKTVTATSTTLTDNNGCTDIVNATSTVYWSGVTGGASCAADPDNCYQITCTAVVGSCTGDSDLDMEYVCTADLAFHAVPTTDINNPYDGDNWLATIRAFDEVGSGAGTSASGAEVVTLLGLDVSQGTIPYGTVRSGQDTGATNATTTLVNYGNVPIDSDVVVDDMAQSGVDYIDATEQEFDLNNFSYGAGSYSIASTSSQLIDVVVARPTSSADIDDDIYWGINIPSGKPSGDYYGENTFTVVQKKATKLVVFLFGL